tara:strand:+ start:109 stop:336 length:228 start_codon:yes stop_codon:yes gene_type:complete
MENKGFAENKTNIVTPNSFILAEKPLEKKTTSKRVDINILKSKLQETESKELKKNIFIFSLLVLALAFVGIYLSF